VDRLWICPEVAAYARLGPREAPKPRLTAVLSHAWLGFLTEIMDVIVRYAPLCLVVHVANNSLTISYTWAVSRSTRILDGAPMKHLPAVRERPPADP
jgi:hypothetical protein